jgi:polysaccharide biosynthesis protein PslF
MPCDSPEPWGSLHQLHQLPRARRVGLLSTYPPALCGLATFAIALEHELNRGGDDVKVVGIDDGSGQAPFRPGVHVLTNGVRESVAAACEVLSSCDVAIIQHEYGIFGGRDGDEVLEILRGIEVPTVVVLHTVPAEPTEHQRVVLERVCELASRVVVMTRAAGERLLSGYDVDEASMRVIPHGATPPTPAPHGSRDRVTDRRPTLLTWGLLGPGKGIEHVIRAMSLLTNLRPAVKYTVAGATHPKVFARDGDDYRRSLIRETWSAGVAGNVHFDDTYRDVPDLMRLVAASTVVVLPYDSRDQATSGVLVDAIAAGRPVIATAFPHAVELLSGGAGIVVPHANPVAMASAIRSVVSDPEHLAALTAKARALAPSLTWHAVASRYRDVFDELVPTSAGVHLS